MLLFCDVLVVLLSGALSKDALRSELEALSCEEREEVVVLAPAAAREFEAQGQALASCIYATYFLLLLLLSESIDIGRIARNRVKSLIMCGSGGPVTPRNTRPKSCFVTRLCPAG